jgi:hypothetical protein
LHRHHFGADQFGDTGDHSSNFSGAESRPSARLGTNVRGKVLFEEEKHQKRFRVTLIFSISSIFRKIFNFFWYKKYKRAVEVEQKQQ